MKSKFEVENPDFARSPLTGLTRNHYIEMAKYLLGRAFSHVRSVDDPITFPIVPGKVYYDDPNFSKLVYNTRSPWEDHDPQGGTSLEYSYRSLEPRDVKGEDVNFSLTGATPGNTPERSMLFSTGLTTGNGAPGTLNRSGKSG